jgi:CheY-like chemotaxis protein
LIVAAKTELARGDPTLLRRLGNTMTRRKRILIAEDEFIFGSVLRFIFRDKYDIQFATNGEEAWQQIQADKIDLLITDYQMPRMNGLILSRTVRSKPGYQTLPIVVVTAKAFEFDFTAIENELFPCEVFVKPFDRQRLLATVARFLTSEETHEQSLVCRSDVFGKNILSFDNR